MLIIDMQKEGLKITCARQHSTPYSIQIQPLFMKRVILTSISLWFGYIFSFVFWPSLLNLPLSKNACADRGLSKIIYMPQKDNLCKWRIHEHQQDQTEKKMSSFKKNPYNFFMNENTLHNCSKNRYLFFYLFIQ